jgi:hypothetical protein
MHAQPAGAGQNARNEPVPSSVRDCRGLAAAGRVPGERRVAGHPTDAMAGTEAGPCLTGQPETAPAGPAQDAAAPPESRTQAAFQDRRVRRDIRTLARFVRIYCDGLHAQAAREPLRLRPVDVEALAGLPVVLCADCRRLLSHAIMKRALCPFDPKPACKHCVKHCYAPHYRNQIRQVMQYAGRRMLFSGRLDYLLHLLF